MAIAALFKPNTATLEALKAYVIKIDSENISDMPLKATLIFEALQKYGVSPAVLADSLGMTIEAVNAYLNKKIDPALTIDFHGKPYKEINRAKVERQIKSIKQAANLTFIGGMSNDWYTNDMAQKLAVRGVSDILDFAAHHNEYELPAGSIVQQETQQNGEVNYFVTISSSNGNEEKYPIDSNNVQIIQDSYDTQRIITKNNLTLDLGIDYYYNKVNGEKFPLSGEVWESAFEGKGGVYYHVKFSKTGIPIFWTQWVSTNTFTDLTPFIGIAVMAFTFGGGAAWLGDSILNAVGLNASAAASEVVGNVAINTALTGGDVTRAVSQAAANLAGGQIGGQIGASVDSATIGKAATVATTAALQGKNVSATSIASALASGLKMDETIIDTSSDYAYDYTYAGDATSVGYDQNAFDLTLADLNIDIDPISLSDSLSANEIALAENGIDISAISTDSGGTVYTQTGDFVAMPEDQYAQSFYPDSEGNVRNAENKIVINASDAANMSPDEIANMCFKSWYEQEGATVNSEAAPASRPAAIPPAANQTKVPSITDQATTYDKLLKTAVSIGASVKAIASGTFRPIYPMSAYGTPMVQAVGVSVQRADGSIVTNNGNGTQTIRYPNGQVQTVATSYNAAGVFGGGLFAGINQQTLMIGGGVLLVALLLARRK
jgi:hypothetical protein